MSKAAELAALIGSQTAQSNRNLVTNGAMQIWQRGTTIDSISNGSYLCDRWRVSHSGLDGNVDVDRSTDVPSGYGFGFSQKISVDASESSLDAADNLRMSQRMEGQNVQSLKKGTSNAEPVTVSFWVKSSVASANYQVGLRDDDNDRDNAKSYTISSVNTWEHKSVTFVGDTTGVLDNDNLRSFDLDFRIDAGTNFTSGTFYNGTWGAGNNTQKLNASTGFLESSSPEWYITGVQLELGEQATPFEHRTFADDLAACQRYYYQPVQGSYLIVGMNDTTSNCETSFGLPVEMRADPSLTTSGTASEYTIRQNGSNNACTSVPSILSGGGKNVLAIRFTASSALNTSFASYCFGNTSGADLKIDAEL